MEWIDALRGSTVGLDTGPLIYYIEEHPALLDVPAGVAVSAGLGVNVVCSRIDSPGTTLQKNFPRTSNPL